MPTLQDFQSKRPNRAYYETITFSHPTFGDVRLVANQIFTKVFSGNTYNPCRMEVTESQQSATPVIDSSVKFGRLAQDFKQQLKSWSAFSRQDPIMATYAKYDSIDMNTPLKTWTVYVQAVSMDQNDVTVTLTLKNPMNNNVSILYSINEYPGLEYA